jgi:hypothetical protein
MNNHEYTVNVEGKDTTFKVLSPSFKSQREAQKIYNKAFSDAINSGSIIRARLDDILIKQGLWDQDKDKKFSELQTKINSGEKTLASGGITLDEARTVAVDMRDSREELRQLIAVKNNLDSNTAEGQADNAKFNYLVSACVVYKETGKTYFQGYEDYNNRSADMVGVKAAYKLANMIYGLEDNFEATLPENKFLKEYGFVNEALDFVDSQGRKTDRNGKLVDINNRFINTEGEYVDAEGNRVTYDGDYVSDFKPFLDSKGKPVVLNQEEEEKTTEEEPKPKKPRTRKKKVQA